MSRKFFLAGCAGLSAAYAVVEHYGGGTWGEALRSFALIFGFWVVVTSVPWSGFEVLRAVQLDERQDGMYRDVLAFTAVVLAVVTTTGAFVELARGDSGPYSFMASVAGGCMVLGGLALPRLRG